ncbi:Lipid phosphate phosphatase 2, partial [Trametes pubescens]
ACAALMWAAAHFIKEIQPYERDFSTKDPLIDHKHRHNQIGGGWNWIFAFFLPVAITVAIGAIRRSPIDIHHSVLGFYTTGGLTYLLTEFLKNRVGRLRPDFLDRCKWNKELKACTGKLDSILDGRRSFPSGHSSIAFAGMMFLSLWIAGATGAWRLTEPVPSGFHRSKFGRVFLSLVPLVFATWVAVSRVEDYRHHKEDVIVGSLLGSTCATICYLIYFPSPFAPDSHGARRLYTAEFSRGATSRGDPYAYELAGLTNERGEQSV